VTCGRCWPTCPAGRSRAPARRGRGADVALRVNAQAWLTVVLLNVVIWAVVCIGAREVIYFWPIWVAGPWGAVLLAQAVSTRRFRNR